MRSTFKRSIRHFLLSLIHLDSQRLHALGPIEPSRATNISFGLQVRLHLVLVFSGDQDGQTSLKSILETAFYHCTSIIAENVDFQA